MGWRFTIFSVSSCDEIRFFFWAPSRFRNGWGWCTYILSGHLSTRAEISYLLIPQKRLLQTSLISTSFENKLSFWADFQCAEAQVEYESNILEVPTRLSNNLVTKLNRKHHQINPHSLPDCYNEAWGRAYINFTPRRSGQCFFFTLRDAYRVSSPHLFTLITI